MKNILFIFIILFVSCKDNNTPEFYADEYCNCLEKYGMKNHFDSAHFICDKRLEEKIYYFKVFVDKDKKKYSRITVDSSDRFMRRFFNEIDKNCHSLWPNNIPNQLMTPFE